MLRWVRTVLMARGHCFLVVMSCACDLQGISKQCFILLPFLISIPTADLFRLACTIIYCFVGCLLFTPVNGPAKQERKFVQDFFSNTEDFSQLRLSTEGTYASLIITAYPIDNHVSAISLKRL
uniref:Uncharacterized protein n=1 Tax=Astyanax mexicanus TaxID=7994 RepID=A0A8B9GRG0_ASTMX